MRFAEVFAALTMTSPHISGASVRIGPCPRNLEAVDAIDSAQVGEWERVLNFYRVVQQNFTPEIEVSYMLFERDLSMYF